MAHPHLGVVSDALKSASAMYDSLVDKAHETISEIFTKKEEKPQEPQEKVQEPQKSEKEEAPVSNEPEGVASMAEALTKDKSREELVLLIDDLAEERDSLQRQLSDLTRPPPATVVSLISQEKPYSIHHLKSYESKKILLEEATKTLIPNTILTVLLFLQESLTPSNFDSIISPNPVAFEAYIAYLKKINMSNKLLALYQSTGRTADHAMLMLSLAYQDCPQVEKRLEAFRECVKLFEKCDTLKWHLSHLTTQVALLETQITIDTNDRRSEYEIFNKFPRENIGPIVGKPLANTLYYCSFYHASLPEDNPSSPLSLLKQFKISERRYVYTQLHARAQLSDWRFIKGLVSKKGIFSSGTKSIIGFEPFIDAVVTNKGPADLLAYFFDAIPLAERYPIAIKYKLYGKAIETVIELKDKTLAKELEEILIRSCEPQSPFIQQLKTALADTKVKWK